ncbi:MAG: flagellar brake protein [Gammaproteobacteria bacterium]|nr:flagellar brake protein [Gammaproteobacteria bacterium]MBU2477691.1 flagellar brake protein [Gammaproteobacteria bacterium]
MAEPPAANQASQYEGKTEKVTHLPQIIGLLRRIRDQRVLLSVRVPGHDGTFNSLLLEVDPEKNIILLDELNPTSGHELVKEEKKIRVQCQCQGIELGFVCSVDVAKDKSGISIYRAAIPDSISYMQRRGSYRVRVGMSVNVPVVLPSEVNQTNIEGQLFDLSIGGLGANLPMEPALKRGQIIETCVIHLPNNETIQAELEIRFVRLDEAHRTQRIGAAFLHLNPQQKNRIRRFVTHLEREMLRRKASI